MEGVIEELMVKVKQQEVHFQKPSAVIFHPAKLIAAVFFKSSDIWSFNLFFILKMVLMLVRQNHFDLWFFLLESVTVSSQWGSCLAVKPSDRTADGYCVKACVFRSTAHHFWVNIRPNCNKSSVLCKDCWCVNGPLCFSCIFIHRKRILIFKGIVLRIECAIKPDNCCEIKYVFYFAF